MGRPGRMKRRRLMRACPLPGVKLLGVVMLAAGMALLFLCVPGWAWAAIAGAVLVAVGIFLATSGC